MVIQGMTGYKAFLRRHPDIVPRKTEPLCTAGAKAEDPEVIAQWFELLDKVLIEEGIKDMTAKLFNTDETGIVTDSKTGTVLAEKGITESQSEYWGFWKGADKS